MYEYWYNNMKPKYSERIRLCCTDTDSFIMHIKTKDIYKDIFTKILLKMLKKL